MWIEHNFMQFWVFIMMFITIGLSCTGIAINVKSYMTMRKLLARALKKRKKVKKQKKQTKRKKKPKDDVVLKEMP